MNVKIKAKQDFIFFGVSFVEKWFPKEKLTWFVRDGSLVLKNQTCFIAPYKKQSVSLDKLLDFLCYLSGGATLARCFVNSSSVPVVASSTERSIFTEKKGEIFSEHSVNNSSEKFFSFRKESFGDKCSKKEKKNYSQSGIRSLTYWEEEAIKAGGGELEPGLPAHIFQDKEMDLKSSKSAKKVFCFNADYLSVSKMKSLFVELPKNTIKGVYGSFRPESGKAFPSPSFQILWPSLLQGYFPRVQMIKCND